MKFKDFEIRKPTLLQEPGEDYYKYNFDLVKWDNDKDGTKYCYSIAFLQWNPKEGGFDFKSVGTRYLEYRENGLEEWLLKWCELKTIEFEHENDRGGIINEN